VKERAGSTHNSNPCVGQLCVRTLLSTPLSAHLGEGVGPIKSATAGRRERGREATHTASSQCKESLCMEHTQEMSNSAVHTNGLEAEMSKKRLLEELATGEGINEKRRKTEEQDVDSQCMGE